VLGIPAAFVHIERGRKKISAYAVHLARAAYFVCRPPRDLAALIPYIYIDDWPGVAYFESDTQLLGCAPLFNQAKKTFFKPPQAPPRCHP
jgi:hypothetical protein